MSEAKFGRDRDFGLYADDKALYGDHLFYYFWEIPIFMLIGVIYGVLGAGFVWMNVQITTWRHKYIPVKAATKRTLEVMFVAFVTASLGFWLCYISPCDHIDDKGDFDKSTSTVNSFKKDIPPQLPGCSEICTLSHSMHGYGCLDILLDNTFFILDPMCRVLRIPQDPFNLIAMLQVVHLT